MAPHLVMQELLLSPGDEWKPQLPGWLFIHVLSGMGYCLEKQLNMELPTGAVLVLSQKIDVNIRASQLGVLNLSFFRVVPELLTGLVTLGEQSFFEAAATRRELSRQFLAPGHPVSVKFEKLRDFQDRRDLSFRLKLLEIFARAFCDIMEKQAVTEPKAPLDAKQRLRQFLEQTLASEWLNMSFAELAQRMNCTPRHLSRIFRDIAGTSFRQKQAKVRLARASELLVSTESKVVDVALDSGFQSLSLFNLMFRKRFGLSPGRWRRERQCHRKKISSPRKLVLMES
jgi:AraC-like DNA-binding protein